MLDEIRALLENHDQQHVLQFWDEISAEDREHLLGQVQQIDFGQLAELVAGSDHATDWGALAERAELPPAISLQEFKSGDKFEQADATGRTALRHGNVAMVLTAGGQGSRLGFDHPKGMFPIGPISNRSLYQIMIEHLMARARQFDTRIPLYIMTSPPTHQQSMDYLESHHYFGYDRDDVQLFCQGVMPAVDDQGKLMLSTKGSLFVSPDGHGGTVDALEKNGILADMRERGIKQVFYGQIDNPLIQVCNPALLGYHIQHNSEMTTQVVRKNDPLQKVGNVVSVDGVVQIIEYSDLPEEHARLTNPDGSLKLWAGSIAVHVFDFDFLVRATKAESLPFHRARKKVAHIDSQGNYVTPDSPNATKFEKFIFDLLPLANNAIVCEVDPAEGFCAVKNAPPAPSETPDHVKAAISDLHRSWLRNAGVDVADGVKVEINSLFAVDSEETKSKAVDIRAISSDTYLE